MSNPFPIPLAIMLSNGSRLATPPASSGTFQLNNNGSNEPVWAAAGSTSAITMLTSDPVPAIDGTAWIVYTGTSPTQIVSLKVRLGGVTSTLISITQ